MAERGDILAIDDDGVSRALLASLLEKQGHEVVVARDGAEGLQLAAQRRFDLILLDVIMPGLGGFEVVDRLKADPALRDVSVIMISSLDDMGAIARAVKLGAEDFIFKPFDETLLKVRVDGCLERRRLRQQERDRQAGGGG